MLFQNSKQIVKNLQPVAQLSSFGEKQCACVKEYIAANKNTLKQQTTQNNDLKCCCCFTYLHLLQEFLGRWCRHNDVTSTWLDKTFFNSSIKQSKQIVVVTINIQKTNLQKTIQHSHIIITVLTKGEMGFQVPSSYGYQAVPM